MTKPRTFEAALRKLESIVDQLESGEIPLDRTIKLYREGMEQYQFCVGKLESVSSELKLLLVDPQADPNEDETEDDDA